MKMMALISILLMGPMIAEAQNKIEVKVDGKTQKISKDPIRVSGSARIEVLVFTNNTNVVESATSEGCGLMEKNNTILPPKGYQQQQQSGTKVVEKKFVVKRSFKPARFSGGLKFKFTTAEMSACPGKNFSVELKFNSRDLETYEGYLRQYTFYFIQ